MPMPVVAAALGVLLHGQVTQLESTYGAGDFSSGFADGAADRQNGHDYRGGDPSQSTYGAGYSDGYGKQADQQQNGGGGSNGAASAGQGSGGSTGTDFGSGQDNGPSMPGVASPSQGSHGG